MIIGVLLDVPGKLHVTVFGDRGADLREVDLGKGLLLLPQRTDACFWYWRVRSPDRRQILLLVSDITDLSVPP